MASFSACQRDFRALESSFNTANSCSICLRRSLEYASLSFNSAWRSISSCMMRRSISSISTGRESICIRRLAAEIERQALLKESDAYSKERRKQIEQQLAVLKEDSSARKSRWQAEKEAIGKIRKLKEQIEQLKAEEQKYERAGELAKVAEIRYGKI